MELYFSLVIVIMLGLYFCVDSDSDYNYVGNIMLLVLAHLMVID